MAFRQGKVKGVYLTRAGYSHMVIISVAAVSYFLGT
jgi:hypothetical protein